MHDHPRKTMIVLVALAGAVRLLGPLPAFAKPTCEKRVNDATKKYFGTLIRKAANACSKTPGGTCFNVTTSPVAAKKIKQCTSAEITALFGGRCPSRDRTCVPTTVTTVDDVAACITCSVKAEVACLTASAFASANLPAGCAGSPSGAFLDPEDEFFAQPTAAGGNVR